MVSVGLIGFGHWGKNHYKSLKDIPGVHVPIVSDPLLEQELKNGTNFVRDYRVIVDSNIDAAVVATPASMHYQIVRDLLLSGKHVLVEKPLTTDLREGSRLCEIAEQQGKTLMVGEIFRFNPGVKYMMEGIIKGVIGDVKYIEARRIGLGPIRQDVGVVLDLASHDVYLANMFMNSRPTKVGAHAVSFNGSVEDVATLALRFPENRIASVYVNWTHPVKERSITVGGTKGAYVFDDVSPTDKVKHFERGVDYQPGTPGLAPFLASVRSGDIHIPSIDLRGSPLERELKHFLDCVEGADCISSGRMGLESLAVLSAAQDSIKENGREVEVKYV